MDKRTVEWQALNRIWKVMTDEQRQVCMDDFKTVATSKSFVDYDCDNFVVKNVEGSYIYLLMFEGRVVYVGKTTIGLRRPFEHYDKKYDEIKMLSCPIEQLDEMEQKYIEQFNPQYNKRGNDGVTFSEKEMRDSISNIFFPEKPLSIPKGRYLVLKANVEPIKINGSWNFTSDMYEKIYNYVGSFGKDKRAIFEGYTYKEGQKLFDSIGELKNIIEDAYRNSNCKEEFIEYLSSYHVAITREGRESVTFYYKNKMISSLKLDVKYTRRYLFKER